MVLQTKNLAIGYGSRVLFSNLNLSLKEGTVTAMLGVNGSGKSTLIKTLSGFTPALSGDITYNGKSITELSKQELASLLSVVLTDRGVNGGLLVEEVIAMGRYPYTNFFGKLTDRDNLVIHESMSSVGVSHLKGRYLAELSDGERQKVMIAKSIAQESKIIILDEPTSFLDIKSRMEMVSLLRRLAKSSGRTFLMSLHDLELSLQYTDNLWILNQEEGILCGATEQMILDGHIDKAAGGGIKFDIEKGQFVSQESEGIPIIYQGENLLWVKSALRREGYYVDNSSGVVTLKVDSYSHIELGDKVCCSITELLEALRELNLHS